ncbi:MAG: homoserine kinase [Myxococcota bacterium]
MKQVRLYVPATIGNVGPGFDVLGLALDGLGNTYKLAVCDDASKVVSVTGIDVERLPQNPEKNLTLLAADNMAQSLGKVWHFALMVNQELPVGGGLGSSAAACLAGAYGAYCLVTGEQPDNNAQKQILDQALILEGHLDNLAPACFGGLTVSSPAGVSKVSEGCPLWVVVLLPSSRLSTKLARSVLPKELPQADWVRQMALSCALVCAWQQGDALGISKALVDPYAEPRRAHLIPDFYELKDSALKAGALGCSISGAGPSIFALFDDRLAAYDFARSHQGHVGAIAKEGIRLC